MQIKKVVESVSDLRMSHGNACNFGLRKYCPSLAFENLQKNKIKIHIKFLIISFSNCWKKGSF